MEQVKKQGTKQKILIVDDSELNRSLLSDMLCDEFEILEAENGMDCLLYTSEILQLLLKAGAADTILPADILPEESLERCRPLPVPQNYYLLLVHHPGRTLPPPVKDLERLLNDTFEPYFYNHNDMNPITKSVL